MLKWLTRLGKANVLLVAHNANYDCRCLLDYIDWQEVIDKAGRFLAVNGVFVDWDTGRQV